MQDDNRLMRTVRVRNDQTLGTLGRLLMAIAEAGGDVGELRLIEQTHRYKLVPNPLDKSVHRAVARAVAQKAIDHSLARAEFVPYMED
jgi:malic enzyme